MKITLFGNCQTKALTWYVEQLNENFDVKWICVDFFNDYPWALNKNFKGKDIPIIFDENESLKRLKDSDYIIFQHISVQKCNYNVYEIKKHHKNVELISISSMFYDTDHPEYLEGMIERANEFNIDIPAHTIIEKHGSKITMQQKNHPHVFYFLELVREICAKTGWDYYSEEQYNQYLKEGYPFG
jgi:hypothetical protein